MPLPGKGPGAAAGARHCRFGDPQQPVGNRIPAGHPVPGAGDGAVYRASVGAAHHSTGGTGGLSFRHRPAETAADGALEEACGGMPEPAAEILRRSGSGNAVRQHWTQCSGNFTRLRTMTAADCAAPARLWRGAGASSGPGGPGQHHRGVLCPGEKQALRPCPGTAADSVGVPGADGGGLPRAAALPAGCWASPRTGEGAAPGQRVGCAAHRDQARRRRPWTPGASGSSPSMSGRKPSGSCVCPQLAPGSNEWRATLS